MCLAVPVKLIEIKTHNIGVVDAGGVKKECRLNLMPEAQVGDYLLLHAGSLFSGLIRMRPKRPLSY